MMQDDLGLSSAGNEADQYLTFTVDGEIFAVPIASIKEIIEYSSITRVPQMDTFMAGVINVRGNVIPVVCLSDRLGFGGADEDSRTCVIVETQDDEGDILEIGLLVEAVDQVYSFSSENTQEAPSFGVRIRKDFISKMAKIGDSFVTALNLKTLLNVKELSKNTYDAKIA